MRKFLLSFLLATTAAAVTTPALAQRTDREDRAEEREDRRKERAEAKKERSDAREARSDAREARSDARDARSQRVEQRQNVQQQTRDRRAVNVNERGRPILDQRQQARDTAATQRQQQRIESRERWVQQAERARRVTPPVGARPDRPAPPPQVATNTRAPQWNTTWRRDSRYDWRRWRDRNRSHFQLGVYFDPFGWNYRRYNVGWRLWPSYYSNQYWLDDPWSYRLPYAPWPYRWVRYYDDAMLVNTFTGEVVDVMYDFFW